MASAGAVERLARSRDGYRCGPGRRARLERKRLVRRIAGVAFVVEGASGVARPRQQRAWRSSPAGHDGPGPSGAPIRRHGSLRSGRAFVPRLVAVDRLARGQWRRVPAADGQGRPGSLVRLCGRPELEAQGQLADSGAAAGLVRGPDGRPRTSAQHQLARERSDGRDPAGAGQFGQLAGALPEQERPDGRGPARAGQLGQLAGAYPGLERPNGRGPARAGQLGQLGVA